MKSDATYTPIRSAEAEYVCAHCGGTIELAEDFYVFTFADRKTTEIVCESCHDDDVRGTWSRGVKMGEEEEQEDSERVYWTTEIEHSLMNWETGEIRTKQVMTPNQSTELNTEMKKHGNWRWVIRREGK